VAQAFEHASRLDRKITPLRHGPEPVPVKRGPEQKPRGTLVIQPKTVVLKPAPAVAPKQVERLVIGGVGPVDRYKR